jgi:hypothetical protein
MGDQLQNMDKTILDNWLQLRVDYRRDKILSGDRIRKVLIRIRISGSVLLDYGSGSCSSLAFQQKSNFFLRLIAYYIN